MINYNNKRFRVLENTPNGETSDSTIFEYKQEGAIVTANYSDDRIKIGHLLGIVDIDGIITMSYHQINHKGELVYGRCSSTPEVLPNGKIRLHEFWQWGSGDKSKGNSVLEEL